MASGRNPQNRSKQGRGFKAGSNPEKIGSKEILVIDDSPTDAELALETLKRAKYAHPVKVATSGEAGLDYLFGTGPYASQGPRRPQLILLDLGLPGMSGKEFLRRVKEDKRTREIHVVIHSTDGLVPSILECERLGASAHVVKPIDFENFVRIATQLKL
jgi:two-component system response regulator